MRKIGVVTTNRADYGLYRPILRRLKQEKDIETFLFVSGAHLSKTHGMTINEIEADQQTIAARIPLDLSSDGPSDIANAMGMALSGFAAAFGKRRPDILLALGDRFEMFAAVSAAVPFLIPIAHIHGGEVTEGAIDDVFRNAISKMSHLHFPTTEAHAARLRQMGEEPWRVTMAGAPGIDNLNELVYLSPEQLAVRFKLPVKERPVLVTFHPVTLEPNDAQSQIDELLAALDPVKAPIVFTAPNNDTNGTSIRTRIDAFIKTREKTYMVEHFGTQGYLSMMKWAILMVGNSSSGIIEAPSFSLPVVNIGRRQQGRVRAANVIDCAPRRSEIIAALTKAMSAAFRDSLQDLKNPYGDGRAAERIVERLRSVPIDKGLLMKRFIDMPVSQTAEAVR